MRTRKPKSKEQKKSTTQNLSSRSLKKKPTINTQVQEFLKSNIIKKFCILEKDKIDKKDLKWVMLGLGYHKKQIKSMFHEQNSNNQEDSNIQSGLRYTISDVYQLCLKNPPKQKWRRQLFDLFSCDRKRVTLQDLQKSWLNMADRMIKHQEFVQLMQEYAIEGASYLTIQQFDKLLFDINSLTKQLH